MDLASLARVFRQRPVVAMFVSSRVLGPLGGALLLYMGAQITKSAKKDIPGLKNDCAGPLGGAPSPVFPRKSPHQHSG